MPKYNTKELENKALEAITKHNLVFADQAWAYLPCSVATVYNHGLEKLESIKEAIEKNKIAKKQEMLNKWIVGENPTLQIAAYKLLSNDQEFDKLTGSKQEIKADIKGALPEWLGNE